MVPFFIAIIIFLIVIIYLIVASVTNLEFIYLLINIPLLFVVIVRSYFQVRHRKILYPYWIALITTTIIFLVFFKYLQVPFILWQILFITIMFLIAELIILSLAFYKQQEIDINFKSWLRKN
jgi:hypothetical protein